MPFVTRCRRPHGGPPRLSDLDIASPRCTVSAQFTICNQGVHRNKLYMLRAFTSELIAHPCVNGDFLQTLPKDKTTVNVFLVNAAFLV
jgi:hypothetical protein